ncbi:MAG: hypothetical protein JXL80_14490 [Planctomycetes bacterium]|nr:hypothetical protein [Planctomycetota bacterium]
MKRRGHSLPMVLAALAMAAAAFIVQLCPAQEAPAEDSEAPAAFQPPPGARVTDEGWFAPRVAQNRPALPDVVPMAAVIPIRGVIELTTYDIVAQKVAEARRDGATMIIFEMNTPGGMLIPTRDIVRMIIDELSDVYTVAFVNPEAYSAGAIISLACDEIIMTPTGVMGDAMPISVSPQGGLQDIPGMLREKGESPLRAEARISARHNGYNEVLCQAMITMSLKVWLIRNRQTGELQYVDAKNWQHKVVGAPPSDDESPDVPTDAAASPWEYLRSVDSDDSLLTVTANEAIAMGLAEQLFENLDQVQAHYHIAELIRLEHTPAQTIAEFMNSMGVSTLLIMATLVLAYMEIRTPGFGIAGVLAIICLGTLIGSRYVLELASHWEILVMAVGLVMLLVEVFITPGFGVLGISGIVLMIAGFLATGIRGANPDIFSWPETSLDLRLLADTGAGLMMGFVGSLIVAAVISKYLPKARFATPLVLADVPTFNEDPAAEASPIRGVRPGDQGVVESVCRPVGKVRIGQTLVDAVSDGSIIEAGARVRVLRHEGNRLIVERIDQ